MYRWTVSGKYRTAKPHVDYKRISLRELQFWQVTSSASLNTISHITTHYPAGRVKLLNRRCSSDCVCKQYSTYGSIQRTHTHTHTVGHLLRHTTYLSADLGFTVILSILYLSRGLSFFVHYPRSSPNGTQPKLATCSEVSAIWKYMSEMWGIPSPTNQGPQTTFSTTSQLNGNSNGLCLRIETWYRQPNEFVDNQKGSSTLSHLVFLFLTVHPVFSGHLFF